MYKLAVAIPLRPMFVSSWTTIISARTFTNVPQHFTGAGDYFGHGLHIGCTRTISIHYVFDDRVEI